MRIRGLKSNSFTKDFGYKPNEGSHGYEIILINHL